MPGTSFFSFNRKAKDDDCHLYGVGYNYGLEVTNSNNKFNHKSFHTKYNEKIETSKRKLNFVIL